VGKTPVPAPPSSPTPAVAASAGTPRAHTGWKKPQVIVAGCAAVISLVALAISIVAATFSYDANNIARGHNKIEAETALTGSSDSLQKRFKEAGIDDIPVLVNFFFQLENNHRAGVISDSFYEQQIMSWCPITRQAYDKLKITWVEDRSFRTIHQSEPWLLARLDKMVGTSRNDKGGCL
jgi:hypothetical protein